MLTFEDFRDDPLIYISENDGIAVNPALDRLIVFKKKIHVNALWSIASILKVSDIRDIQFIDGKIERSYFSVQNNPVAGNLSMAAANASAQIGEAFGKAIQHSLDKRKARRNTGIIIVLRSIETPTIFLNEPATIKRDILVEALRQLVEGTSISKQIKSISADFSKSFPSKELLEHKGALQGNWWLVGQISVGLAVFAGVVIAAQVAFDKFLDWHASRAYLEAIVSEPDKVLSSTGETCLRFEDGRRALQGRGVNAIALEDLNMIALNGAFRSPSVDPSDVTVIPKDTLLQAYRKPRFTDEKALFSGPIVRPNATYNDSKANDISQSSYRTPERESMKNIMFFEFLDCAKS